MLLDFNWTNLVVLSTMTSLFVYLFNKWKCGVIVGLPTFGEMPLLGNWHMFKFALGITKIKSKIKNSGLQNFINGLGRLFGEEGICHTRLGFQSCVMLFRGRTAESILKSKTQLAKGNIYDALRDVFGKGLMSNDDLQSQRRHRKHINPSFYTTVINDIYLPVMNQHAQELVESLKSSTLKEFVDIFAMLKKTAYGIIMEAAMGISPDMYQSQSEDNSSLQEKLDLMTKTWVKRLGNPFLQKDWVISWTSAGRKYMKARSDWLSFARKVLKDRKKEFEQGQETSSTNEETPRKRKAFLDLLLTEQSFNQGTFTDQDVFDHTITFMLGGYDTTAVTLAWVLYMLGHHPNVQSKLQEELDSIFGLESNTPPGPITPEDMSRMKYMEKVIKEVMRLFSTIPFVGRKTNEDLQVGGKVIPSGTTFIVFIDAIHRNPADYKDPLNFDPEREFPENCYFPFSSGPRDCIGKTFAMTEMKVVLSLIFRSLKVKSLDPRDQLYSLPSIVGLPNKPIRIKVDFRS